jgi:hypothetical protein
MLLILDHETLKCTTLKIYAGYQIFQHHRKDQELKNHIKYGLQVHIIGSHTAKNNCTPAEWWYLNTLHVK